tara:strand:- start:2836 stop:2958 length:123 start_codon:yes stop_codon:yes gene_type:complete
MELFGIGVGLLILEALFWLGVLLLIYKRKKPKKSIWHEEP